MQYNDITSFLMWYTEEDTTTLSDSLTKFLNLSLNTQKQSDKLKLKDICKAASWEISKHVNAMKDTHTHPKSGRLEEKYEN